MQSISVEQKEKLLLLAREAITKAIKKEELDLNKYDEFSENQGAFVTLTKKEELRGCIGYTESYFPLNETIAKAARSAAFNDPRFPILEESELNEIIIEISVLTKPQKIVAKDTVDIINQIKVGEDGLIIQNAYTSGLLLPQVATDYKWDAKTFLEQTCKKAGLGVNAWIDPETQILKFQAIIFSED